MLDAPTPKSLQIHTRLVPAYTRGTTFATALSNPSTTPTSTPTHAPTTSITATAYVIIKPHLCAGYVQVRTQPQVPLPFIMARENVGRDRGPGVSLSLFFCFFPFLQFFQA